jgi:hypothetical protein
MAASAAIGPSAGAMLSVNPVRNSDRCGAQSATAGASTAVTSKASRMVGGSAAVASHVATMAQAAGQSSR